MNSSDWIVGKLADLGYTDCFAVTGGAAGQLFDALARQNRITVHFLLHEQACAMACDAYFRYFGRPAVLLVTNGPGVSNTVTGVLGAFQDSIPMMCISGQVPTKFINTNPYLRQLGVQEAPTQALIGGIVKRFDLLSPERSLHTLCDSHITSLSSRMGPVWLEVPLDTQARSVDSIYGDCASCNRQSSIAALSPRIDLAPKVREMWATFLKSNRPLIVIGHGVRLAGLEDKITKFIETLGAPVVASWSAADLMPHDNKYYVGNFGILGERAANAAIQEADFLLILGCRMSVPAIGYESASFSPHSYKVMVDVDIHEVLKPTLEIDLGLPIGLDEFLMIAQEGARPHSKSDWLRRLGSLKKELRIENESFADADGGVDAYRVIAELSKALNRFDAVVTDMGTSFTATMQALRRNGITRVMTSSGTSSMGFGLPGALGLALAEGDLRVLCIAGDGGFQMNLQEVQTWATKAENLKVIILDSDGYLAISLMQDNLFAGRRIGSDKASGVGSPRFSQVFEAFGIPAYEVDDVLDFPRLFSDFVSAEGKAALVVRLPARQVMRPRVQTRIGSDGQATSPRLDQMWPDIKFD